MSTRSDHVALRPTMFAFWGYDLFPYTLGAEATKMDERGYVYVPAYQAWVKPLRLMPLKAGRALHQALKVLENDRKIELGNVEERHLVALRKLFPEAK